MKGPGKEIGSGEYRLGMTRGTILDATATLGWIPGEGAVLSAELTGIFVHGTKLRLELDDVWFAGDELPS